MAHGEFILLSHITPPLDIVVVTPYFTINQLLVKDFTIDSITVKAQQTTFAPGVDYMADYDEWLFIQVREAIRVNVYIDPMSCNKHARVIIGD